MNTGAMKGDEHTEYALRRGDGTMNIRSPGGTEHLPGHGSEAVWCRVVEIPVPRGRPRQAVAL
jgi:hypothetical protein